MERISKREGGAAMRLRQAIEALLCYSVSLFAIGLLWMALEALIYGEVQPRAVDDLIALAWSAMAWAAYGLGCRHGKERRGFLTGSIENVIGKEEDNEG